MIRPLRIYAMLIARTVFGVVQTPLSLCETILSLVTVNVGLFNPLWNGIVLKFNFCKCVSKTAAKRENVAILFATSNYSTQMDDSVR